MEWPVCILRSYWPVPPSRNNGRKHLRFLEFDGSNQAQDIIPTFFDNLAVDIFVRPDVPVLVNSFFARFEDIEHLLFQVFDARRVGKTEQMRGGKNRFAVAVGIGGMDIAFDDIVIHQPVDHIGAFALCGAEHKGMPEQIALIDKSVGAHAQAFAKIFGCRVCRKSKC